VLYAHLCCYFFVGPVVDSTMVQISRTLVPNLISAAAESLYSILQLGWMTAVVQNYRYVCLWFMVIASTNSFRPIYLKITGRCWLPCSKPNNAVSSSKQSGIQDRL